MHYSTVQVTPQMRRRLARYKVKGMSYEAVLAIMLDAIPPEEFHARAAAAQKAKQLALAGVGRRDPLAAAEEARRAEGERIARMSPAERMEDAYHLFEVMREDA
ncbi:MAG: hypothetical protein WDA16_11905 [Candidatus Thermoplasmatota archaeon]